MQLCWQLLVARQLLVTQMQLVVRQLLVAKLHQTGMQELQSFAM